MINPANFFTLGPSQVLAIDVGVDARYVQVMARRSSGTSPASGFSFSVNNNRGSAVITDERYIKVTALSQGPFTLTVTQEGQMIEIHFIGVGAPPPPPNITHGTFTKLESDPLLGLEARVTVPLDLVTNQ